MAITKEALKNLTIDDFKVYEGIPWEHNKTDCYTLVQKVYAELFQTYLHPYDRAENWWTMPEIYNLYKDNYEREGFSKIEITEDNPLQIGDAILMKIGCEVPVHAAIYVGDNKILHLFMKRNSIIEDYNGVWLETTSEVIRHKNFF